MELAYDCIQWGTVVLVVLNLRVLLPDSFGRLGAAPFVAGPPMRQPSESTVVSQ
jgi:hypothetical protein